MKITFDFSPFDELLKRLGAENIEWHSTALISKRETILHQLQNEGIEVGINDLDITEEGLFTYASENIVIYIKDQTTSFRNRTISSDDLNLPKFHFSECGIIKRMRKDGRYERYLASSRKTGYFPVDHKDEGGKDITEDYKLSACFYCVKHLKRINSELYNKYSDAQHFNLESFFNDCKSMIYDKTLQEARNYVQTGYTKDWPDVSRRYREKCGYRCELCGIDLSKRKYLLDVHHKNGVKTDNNDNNLEALCKLCHSQQSAHSHYKPKPEYIEIINELRKEQGLPTD